MKGDILCVSCSGVGEKKCFLEAQQSTEQIRIKAYTLVLVLEFLKVSRAVCYRFE